GTARIPPKVSLRLAADSRKGLAVSTSKRRGAAASGAGDALTGICHPARALRRDPACRFDTTFCGSTRGGGMLRQRWQRPHWMNARLRNLAVLLTVLAVVPVDAPARTTTSQTLGPSRTGAVVRELRFQQSR